MNHINRWAIAGKTILSLFVIIEFFVALHVAHAAYEISDGSVKALYHMENTTDDSGNGYTLIEHDVTSTTGMFRNAYKIDQSDSSLTGSLSVTSAPFGVSLWINLASSSATNSYLLDFGSNQGQLQLYNGGGGSHSLHLYYCGSGAGSATFDSTTSALHNIVLNYHSNNTFEIYVDGNTAADLTGTCSNMSFNSLHLGAYGGGNGNPMYGIMDDVVFRNSSFTTSTTGDIASIWSSGSGSEVCATSGCGTSVVGISDGSVRYLYHLGSTNDASGDGFDLSQNGGSFVVGKFGTAYNAAASSTADRLSFSGSSTLPLEHGVSFWLKADQIDDSQYIANFTNGDGNQCGIQIYSSVGHSHVIASNNQGDSTFYASTTLATGQWYNVVLNMSETSTVAVYVNGIFDGTGNIGEGANHDCGTAVVVGNTADGQNPIKGTLDDFVVLARQFNPTEISAIWNSGVGREINALSVRPTTLIDGTAGTAYSQLLTASGTISGLSTWSVSSGTLPTGLTLATSNPGATTTISGTPSVIAASQFTISFTNGSSTATKNYALTIDPAAATSTEITDGTVDFLYHMNNITGNYTNSASSSETLIASSTTTSTAKLSEGWNINNDGYLQVGTGTLLFPQHRWLHLWTKFTNNNNNNYIWDVDQNVCHLQNYQGILYYNGSQITTSTLADNNWHMVDIDDNAGSMHAWIDDVDHGTTSVGNCVPTVSPETPRIGNAGSGGVELHGLIDEVALIHKSPTQSAIDKLWNNGNGRELCTTSGCGRSTYEISDGSVKALYHMEDTADSSGNGYTLTEHDVTSTTGIFLNAYKINQSDSSLTATLPVTSAPFGASLWVNASGSGATNQYLLDFGSNQGQLQLYNGGGSTDLHAYYCGSGAGAATLSSNSSTWHNIILNYHSNNTYEIYVDGNTTADLTGTCSNMNFSSLHLGAYGGGNGNPLSGKLDDVVFRNTFFTTSTTGDIKSIWNDGVGREVCKDVGC